MMPSATWMDLEMTGPGLKPERNRQIPYDIDHMCNLKYSTRDCIYKTDSQNRPVVAKGKRE